MQHDVEEEKIFRLHMHQFFHEHQMPRRTDGQKFGQTLHEPEDERLPETKHKSLPFQLLF